MTTPVELSTPSLPRPRLRDARAGVVGWSIFVFGVLALLCCPIRRPFETVRPLPVVQSEDALAGNGVFTPDGVVATDRYEPLPPGLRARGSLIGGDVFQGRHSTGWYRPAEEISIMVAGWPMQPGNQLVIELLHADGRREEIPFALHDIGETWLRWTTKLPKDVTSFRIVATDGSTGPGGWLAFSEPFTAHPVLSAQLWGIFQLITATCLALTLLCGPGLLWLCRRERSLSSLALATLPGPLLLAGLGCLCWLLGGVVSPTTVARIGVTALLIAIGVLAWRRRIHRQLPSEVRMVTGICALLVGFAVAKANVSFGPSGELFGGRVSRTLAVGNHSDSQISFHFVQVVAHHLGPYASQTQLYFAPWRLGSRGPLSGLMAAPIVLASGARVPFDHPTHPWRPFDREGFAVYRIACIVLASLAGWVVFGVAAGFTSLRWVKVAFVSAALAPFFVHEIYFTWPKLMAAANVVLSFLCVHRGRRFAGGLILAIGYLYHPLAALSGPFIALWSMSRQGARAGERVRALSIFLAGAALLVIPWQLVGRLHPDGGANQDVFLSYFLFADSAHATWSTWWQSRWDNFANTFLPGYLLTADPTHESLNSAHGPSDRWVQASFLYWNTLPLALGIPGFLFSVTGIGRAVVRAPSTVLATVIGPALLLVVYWGAASTGLMRQCGHALFLSAILVSAWSCARWEDAFSQRMLRVYLHPACLAWRAFEVALMAFGTTLLNQRPELSGLFGWNDLISLAAAAVFLGMVMLLCARTGLESLKTPKAKNLG